MFLLAVIDIIFVVVPDTLHSAWALCNSLLWLLSLYLGELSDSDEEDSDSDSADDIQPFEGGLVTSLAQSSIPIYDLDTSGSLTDSDDDAIGQTSRKVLKVSPKHSNGKSKKSKKRKKSHKQSKHDTVKRIKSKWVILMWKYFDCFDYVIVKGEVKFIQ